MNQVILNNTVSSSVNHISKLEPSPESITAPVVVHKIGLSSTTSVLQFSVLNDTDFSPNVDGLYILTYSLSIQSTLGGESQVFFIKNGLKLASSVAIVNLTPTTELSYSSISIENLLSTDELSLAIQGDNDITIRGPKITIFKIN